MKKEICNICGFGWYHGFSGENYYVCAIASVSVSGLGIEFVCNAFVALVLRLCGIVNCIFRKLQLILKILESADASAK